MKKLFIGSLLGVCAASAFAGPLEGFESKLTLSVDAVSSDINSLTFRSLIETQRRAELTTITGRFRYIYQEQRVGGIKDITADNWLLFGLYEQVMDAKLDWYFSASLEKDRIVDLDLRQLYTAGLAYKLRNEEDVRWKVRAGLGLLNENFKSSADNDDLILEFGSDYYRKLNEKWNMFHLARFVPRPGDFSDYYFQSDLGANYKVSDRIDASFRFLLDYDKTPSTGFRKDRLQWIVGVGYKF